MRITQQIHEERVGVGDPSRVGIQEEYAVFCRLEEPPVTNFGSLQLVLDPLAIGDFIPPERPFDGVQAGQPVSRSGRACTQGDLVPVFLSSRKVLIPKKSRSS